MPPSWSDISGAGLDGLAVRGFDKPVIAFSPQAVREVTCHAGGQVLNDEQGDGGLLRQDREQTGEGLRTARR